MITLVRSKDGTIKTFSAHPFTGYSLALGEFVELVDTTFQEFAQRFVVSCAGKSGENISVKCGDPALTVQISCPGVASVDVDINGTVETLTLTDGVAEIDLSAEVPGLFIIQPADRTLYCAAGQAVLTIEVTP